MNVYFLLVDAEEGERWFVDCICKVFVLEICERLCYAFGVTIHGRLVLGFSTVRVVGTKVK